MLRAVEMWQVVCDTCGKFDDADPALVAWSDAGSALEVAKDSGWTFIGDQHYCEGCGAPACSCGHWYGEHDYGEAGCEDCDCPTYRRAEQIASAE